MEMIPVSSSNLVAIGYDENSSTLRIEFLKSGTYEYYDVPQVVYEDLLAAGSKGQYHNQYIKNGSYRYSKV